VQGPSFSFTFTGMITVDGRSIVGKWLGPSYKWSSGQGSVEARLVQEKEKKKKDKKKDKKKKKAKN